MMWQVINEERGGLSNIASYYNITYSNAMWVYNLINRDLHDTTLMLLPTIEVVTYNSNMCMLLFYVTLHYD